MKIPFRLPFSKSEQPNPGVITPQDLKRLLATDPPPHVIDVRTASEFASGHIPGAINIPLPELELRKAEIQTEGQTVMVCRSGMRSSSACAMVWESMPGVLNLQGGTEAWKRAGFAISHEP